MKANAQVLCFIEFKMKKIVNGELSKEEKEFYYHQSLMVYSEIEQLLSIKFDRNNILIKEEDDRINFRYYLTELLAKKFNKD